MKPKKNQKSNLNNYTATFLLIGLVSSLFVALQIINLKTTPPVVDLDKLHLTGSEDTEQINIQIEEPKPKPENPKPKPRIIAKLKVVKDDTKQTEDELLATDPDNNPVVAIDSIKTETIEDINVEYNWVKVEQVPAFPGCKGNNEALKKCLNDKIKRFISKHFNAEIAQDLGLSGERVKIMAQFTIDKTGKITNIKTRSKYKDLASEATRVIKKLPEMTPGRQRNRPVKVTYTLPIIFKVSE